MSDSLPTTEAEWAATPRPVPLEPDATDLYHASHISLPPCPFCGKQRALVFGEINRQTGIIGYRVECDIVYCGASTFFSSIDREEARKGAIERWSKRA